MLEALRQKANAQGILSFRDYVECCLYAPEIGYYMQERQRVGRCEASDFYTACNIQVLPELLIAAYKNLLGGDDLGEYTLVEIGPEPGQSIFAKNTSTFKAVQCVRRGDALELPSKALVFANEILDAQPFHRLIYREGQWRECGVKIANTDSLEFTELPELSADARVLAQRLPQYYHEGFIIDLSLDAERLVENITDRLSSGVMLWFDYGLPLSAHLERPHGTARAYRKHAQNSALLAQPGEQDITYHVCWDFAQEALQKRGWSTQILRQESFFVHKSAGAIEALSIRGPEALQGIKEVLHPALLGAKFEVLLAQKARG